MTFTEFFEANLPTGIVDKIVTNSTVLLSDYTVEEFQEKYNMSEDTPLSMCFIWADTPEGYEYWLELEVELRARAKSGTLIF